MATTVPLRTSNPTAASYDQGTDIQPAVSWSSKTDSAPTPSSTSAALERNLNPLDKEDPRQQTKTLPFAGVDSAEVARTVVTPSYNDVHLPGDGKVYGGDFQSSNNSSAFQGHFAHNGNILDRTMDQIRGWVHSFQQQKEGNGDYEDYLEEVSNDHSSTKGAPSSLEAAKSRISSLASQTSSTLQQVGSVASDKVAGVSSTVRQQAEGLQHRVGDAVHTVSDRANTTVQQVKAQVNDFIQSHQSQPGEPLTATISHSIQQQLPSSHQVQDTVNAILPPLAQQASSSYAFLGSFLTQFLSTYKDYFLALRRQSLPLQAMTAILFVTHFVLPLFFLEKGPARSVIYCYVIASALSHLTFFLSGHLRYQFLAHFVFIPMLLSLVLHAGFGEASQAHAVSDEYQDGNTLKAILISPISLRSYFFVLWLRVVLMVQASLLTLDAVNVLDMLGFSLETRRGQEMALIHRSVSQMRRNFAHSVAPPPTTSHQSMVTTASHNTSTSSTRPTQMPSSTSAAIGSNTALRSTSSLSAEERQPASVVVQSHEKATSTSTSNATTGNAATEGLRERKPHSVHPTYYVNAERV